MVALENDESSTETVNTEKEESAEMCRPRPQPENGSILLSLGGGGGPVTRRLLALNKRGHWHLVAKTIRLF